MKRFDYPTEILDVMVHRLNDKGQGVARYRHPANAPGNTGKGLTITVPNTVPGDRVRVEIPNAKGRRAAHLNSFELLEASTDRDLSNPLKESIATVTFIYTSCISQAMFVILLLISCTLLISYLHFF